MKFSDRDEELRLLDRLYEGCVRGKGAVVLANGSVGCGKTALLQTFASRVKENGGLFLSVTASASERLHLFGLIDQLVSAIRAAGMTADPLAAEEVDVTVSADDQQGAPRIPLGLLQRISRSISEFADRGPLVLGIDDVHFADEPSLQCLRYLIRRIDTSAVLIVMNESSCHERELATLHAETLHLPYCHRIRLGTLTVSGTADQLTRRFGAAPAADRVQRWAEVSGGNPLLLNALVEDAPTEDRRPGREGAAPGAPEPGESFRHAFLRCLHRCEPSMLATARVLAVLGESASPVLIGDFLGIDATSVRRGLADLNSAGLLSQLRFRHDSARQAVLADISPDDLHAMHGRAAGILHASGATAREVAEQLMATHGQTQSSWHVEILREAAREALDAGDAPRTADYLRHASGICDDPAKGAHIAAALAEAQWLIDPVKATRYLPYMSHLVSSGVLTGADAMVPVKHLMWRGDFTQADALLSIIESGAGPAPAHPPWVASPVDVEIGRLWLSFMYPGLARESPAAGAGGDAPLPHTAAARPVSLLTLLNVSATLAGGGDESQGADQVLHGADAASPLIPTLFALVLLIQTHRFDEAVQWSDRLLAEPWTRRVPMRRAMFETIKAAASLRKGDPVTAGESAHTALDIVTAAGWGVVVGLPLALAVRAATERRDFDAVMPYLNTAVPPVMFDTPFALPYLQALGRYHLAMGRPHTALTNFQSCGDLMRQWGTDSPELADWRKDAVAALVAMRQPGRARTLLEEQLSLLGDGRSRARGIALRRLAAISSAPDRQSLLTEAIRILADCGDEFELGRAQADMDAALDTHDRGGLPRGARGGPGGVRGGPGGVRGGPGGPNGAPRGARGGPDSGRSGPRDGPDGSLPAKRAPAPMAYPGRFPAAERQQERATVRDTPPSPARTGPPAPYRTAAPGESTGDDSGGGPALAELTDAERRVGALAVAGCTNREIAFQLFITVSTVEQHLTKIYRKLKVRSRSDLPAELLAFTDLPCFPNGG
ncbi:helix-turn-helix transcriptional regulator [Streptomyces katsurahamanus]|uniref:helix-turn-helix transcriptional regulator n=1 Tax=Streptomyces katsurahamanus TaxID=2577098 RepID=UPI001886806A|nr:LuxR family transcriptional regulator [Streptomyces katsurahamanus]